MLRAIPTLAASSGLHRAVLRRAVPSLAAFNGARALSAAAPPRAGACVMLYDGACPVCAREVSFLKTLQRADRVSFVDITAPGAPAAAYTSKPLDELQGEMHVLDEATGTMHTRVDAFRKLYATLGYNFLEFTRRPPFDWLSDRAYSFIAAHKHRLAFLFK